MKLSLIIVLAGAGLFAADSGEELQTAARRGQTAEVRRLLESGAALESKNQYGATPLYLAVFNGHTETALLLLEKGANPNVTDTFYKSSVLDAAMQKGRSELIRALIGKGAVPTARQLNIVVMQGNAGTLQALLAHRFSAEDLTAALKAALAAKKDDMAAALRKAGAPEPKPVDVPPELLSGYAGQFVSPTSPIAITISAEGTTLKGQGEGQGQFAFNTDSPSEFSFLPANIRIVFDGKDKFTLHQGGQQYIYARKDSAAAPSVRTVSDLVLTRYAGRYASSEIPLEFELTTSGGRLFLQATGQPKIPLQSESDTEFTFTPASIRIRMQANGQLLLHQAGKDFTYSRKPEAK